MAFRSPTAQQDWVTPRIALEKGAVLVVQAHTHGPFKIQEPIRSHKGLGFFQHVDHRRGRGGRVGKKKKMKKAMLSFCRDVLCTFQSVWTALRQEVYHSWRCRSWLLLLVRARKEGGDSNWQQGGLMYFLSREGWATKKTTIFLHNVWAYTRFRNHNSATTRV